MRIIGGLLVVVPALLVTTVGLFLFCFWGGPFRQSRQGPVPLTPPWALECWLWEDDTNTAASVKELLAGYAEHDLPVRTILIDSPWSHRYNDFKVDENRYPKPAKFFGELEDQGYRVVLWMTCLVNSYSKDTRVRQSQDVFDEARKNGYLAGSGESVKWWKGQGGFIDYSNPEALKWWQGLQQQVLDWGIDGWKLDGADTLFSTRPASIPLPFNRTHAAWMTTRQYMDYYARKEYQHGLKHNPEFITLIRAMDGQWTHPEGFAPLDAAPVTWVGDNRHTWSYEDQGIEEALTDILGSARLGYCVIGSDVAGYHGHSNPEDITATAAAQSDAELSSPSKTEPSAVANTAFGTAAGNNEIAPNVYIRWAQFSTFCGLFLNGGHGDRRLWKRTQPELEIVRKFSWLHTELVPYIYSHVVTCHHGGLPLMRPLDAGTFHYMFGDDFLVAPIHENKLSRAVSLPPGRWRYLFLDREVLQGPRQLVREFPLDEYPVFIRDGAVVPLNVTRPYTGFGDQNSAEFTTWLVYPNGRSEFTLWHPDTHPRPEWTKVNVDSGPSLRIDFSGKHVPHTLRILADNPPARITLDGRELAEHADWNFETDTRRIVIITEAYTHGAYRVESTVEPAGLK